MPKYNVTYIVTRCETYAIEANNEMDAYDLAFMEGEELKNSGVTTNVQNFEIEEVE